MFKIIPWLHSQFKASLAYMRSCLKNKKAKSQPKWSLHSSRVDIKQNKNKNKNHMECALLPVRIEQNSDQGFASF